MDKEDMTPEDIAGAYSLVCGPQLEDIAGDICAVCGLPTVSFADDLEFDGMVAGKRIVIPLLTGLRCSNCGDFAFDTDSSKILNMVKAFYDTEIAERRADRQGLPPGDIAGATCPLCGSSTIRFADDLTFAAVLNRTKIEIPNLTGIRCSTCKNYAFDADSSKIIDQEIQDAKK